jgi:hypothetical protein
MRRLMTNVLIVGRSVTHLCLLSVAFGSKASGGGPAENRAFLFSSGVDSDL